MAPVDYIVVGAGSAGCVLANRLSEDPSVRALLLEAGGKDRSPDTKIPAALAKQFHTKLDWDFATEPEPHVDGRSLYIPRGKSLGGSGSINAMLSVRGRPPAPQEPRRRELHKRDALRPRAPARVRPLGGAGRARLGLARRASVLPEVR